jgi:hypothetical protein
MQAITPLRAAEEPLFDLVSRRVSWCSPIPELHFGESESQGVSPEFNQSDARSDAKLQSMTTLTPPVAQNSGLQTTPKNTADEAPPMQTPGSVLRTPSWCAPRVLFVMFVMFAGIAP